ncbi:hypothetical protein BB561_001646 [Smittium simulii]|uniref:DH domain-containing protein n=1 Tax=Smittium simulii TaxID=133385 RepID=A0A2T9YTR9_9FUNG|nr:hypothetical protein BB561_001646 [Smittium simulii]
MSPNFTNPASILKKKKTSSSKDCNPQNKSQYDSSTFIEKTLLQKLTFNSFFKYSNKKQIASTSTAQIFPSGPIPLTSSDTLSFNSSPTPTPVNNSTTKLKYNSSTSPKVKHVSSPVTATPINKPTLQHQSNGTDCPTNPDAPLHQSVRVSAAEFFHNTQGDSNHDIRVISLENTPFTASKINTQKPTSEPITSVHSAESLYCYDNLSDSNIGSNKENLAPIYTKNSDSSFKSLKKSKSLKSSLSYPNSSYSFNTHNINNAYNPNYTPLPLDYTLPHSNIPSTNIKSSTHNTLSHDSSLDSFKQNPSSTQLTNNSSQQSAVIRTPKITPRDTNSLNRSFTIQQISSAANHNSNFIMVKSSKGVLATINKESNSYPQNEPKVKPPTSNNDIACSTNLHELNILTSSSDLGPTLVEAYNSNNPSDFDNSMVYSSLTKSNNLSSKHGLSTALTNPTPSSLTNSVPDLSKDIELKTPLLQDYSLIKFSEPKLQTLDNNLKSTRYVESDYFITDETSKNLVSKELANTCTPESNNEISNSIIIGVTNDSKQVTSMDTTHPSLMSPHVVFFQNVDPTKNLSNDNKRSSASSISDKIDIIKTLPNSISDFKKDASDEVSTLSRDQTLTAKPRDTNIYSSQKSTKESNAMRLHSSQELMFTEKSFAENLYIVKKMWMEPVFASANASKPIIPYQAARIIFFQFDELHSHALQFYTELESELSKCNQRLADGSLDSSCLKMGSLFKSRNRAWQLFVSYVENYSTAMHLLNQLSGYKPFTKYEETLILSKQTARQSLKDLLMLPIQRVMRYSLLLKTILKHTPIDYLDHLELCRAVKTVTQLAVVVNTARRRQEESQYTIDVIRSIENCPTLPLSPDNKFLFDFVIQELVLRIVTRLYVFSNYLIVTKLHTNSKLNSNSMNYNYPTPSNSANQTSMTTSSNNKNAGMFSNSSNMTFSNSSSTGTPYSMLNTGNPLGGILSNNATDNKESWIFYSYAPLNQVELQNADEHADTLVTVLALNRYKPQKGFHRRSQSVSNLADSLSEKLEKNKSTDSNKIVSNHKNNLKGINNKQTAHKLASLKLLEGNSVSISEFEKNNPFSNTSSVDKSTSKNTSTFKQSYNNPDSTNIYNGKLSIELLGPQDPSNKASKPNNTVNKNKESDIKDYKQSSTATNSSNAQIYSSLGTQTVAMELMQSFIPPPPLRTHLIVLQHDSSESRRNFVKSLKKAQSDYLDQGKKNREKNDTFSGLNSQTANGFSNEKFLKEKLRKQSLFNTKLERHLSILHLEGSGNSADFSDSSSYESTGSEYTSSDENLDRKLQKLAEC